MKTSQIVLAFLVIFLISDITFAYGPWQGNWRWRNDDGDVYTATWKDSVNTPVILTDYENIRLRIENIFVMARLFWNISLSYTEDVKWSMDFNKQIRYRKILHLNLAIFIRYNVIF